MPFDVWTVIDPEAMQVMREHVTGTPQAEVGGFLLGEHGAPHEPPRVVAAIAAHDAEGDLTHLTFTHAAWENVHRVMDADFPDSSIIGWYHSHPGHGIFLSAHDKFIQRNFFSAPWQIAVVIDPVARTEGFFAWAHDDIVLVSEREIGGHAFAPATAAARAAFKGRQGITRGPRRKLVVSFDDDPIEHRPPTVATPDEWSVPSIDHAASPTPSSATRDDTSYPLAGHLLPVVAGLMLGAILALLA